ncbi:TRAP transporter small permease [Jannaschia sp. LMIT008]|uniref:TRAP transporter small permease n=1 Tax=Jannaschia maritima TaxID=3032585 RepID=UPI002810B78B|nr:TRAP transporter small permease subunit [Jannaschia sp. LMIT008]
MGWFDGIGSLIQAMLSGDLWMLQSAMRAPAAWTLGLAATILGGILVAIAYRFVPILDRLLEPVVMVVSYLTIGGIIFAGVVQRFFLNGQPSWSTTLPPFLFLIMTWFGASYNVKLRTHLAFNEFRSVMPRPMQMACLTLDAVLWIGFAWVVVVTATQETIRAAANFAIMLGTDDVMQWWFLAAVPLAFVLLAGRAFENLFEDLGNLRRGDPLIRQAVIGGDA